MKYGLSRTIAFALIMMAIIPALVISILGYFSQREAVAAAAAKKMEVVAAAMLDLIDRFI